MRTDLRPSRRSFLSALLASLVATDCRATVARQPQAARMTIAEGWDWLFRWCGLSPAIGLLAAA